MTAPNPLFYSLATTPTRLTRLDEKAMQRTVFTPGFESMRTSFLVRAVADLLFR
jgi:hypothetical protein